MAIELVVGLGNPGPRYDWTRHNVGFHAVERLAALGSDSGRACPPLYPASDRGAAPASGWQSWREQGLVLRVSLSRPVWVAKPQTYMNASGEFIRAFCAFYKLPPESILVVYDDMDLPLGRIRLRKGGSSGGHKGLESIISRSATQEIPRLRLGIGRRPGDEEGKDYVLSRFTASERKIADQMVARASEAIRMACEQGLEPAMNRYNAEAPGP